MSPNAPVQMEEYTYQTSSVDMHRSTASHQCHVHAGSNTQQWRFAHNGVESRVHGCAVVANAGTGHWMVVDVDDPAVAVGSTDAYPVRTMLPPRDVEPDPPPPRVEPCLAAGSSSGTDGTKSVGLVACGSSYTAPPPPYDHALNPGVESDRAMRTNSGAHASDRNLRALGCGAHLWQMDPKGFVVSRHSGKCPDVFWGSSVRM